MIRYNSKPFVLFFWLNLAVLAVLASACSPASQPLSTTAPEQAPGGILLQDAPPTPEFETVEIDTDQISPLDLGQQSLKGCPKVESQLGQIIQNPNPLETARQLGFRVQGDKIQVLLVLDSENVTFLQDFGVEIGKQAGTQVQAFVPLSRVCELASTDNVLAIRLPGQGVAQ
jgi:hypothetical protein